MASLSRVMLIGNLGRDAELRYTPKGTAVCSFSLAVNQFVRAKEGAQGGEGGQRSEKTEWFRVTLWSRQAESLHDYLKKGKTVFVEGPLEVRTYEDREGKQRYSLEVRADVIQFVGGRQGTGTREEGADDFERPAQASAAPSQIEQPGDDDIPF